MWPVVEQGSLGSVVEAVDAGECERECVGQTVTRLAYAVHAKAVDVVVILKEVDGFLGGIESVGAGRRIVKGAGPAPVARWGASPKC